MERSVLSQIVDTLHLMLRIVLGFIMAYISVATAGFITLFLLLSARLSSKYGPVYEEDIFWPMVFLLIGAIPSLLAACILIFKNKLVARNPRETAFAAINILPAFLSMQLFPRGNDAAGTPELLLALLAASLYGASAVAIIIIARSGRAPTSVK